MIRFRPHHFLCALGFQGKGYSDKFTANMAEIVDRLRGPGGENVMLHVTHQADAICGPCPHKRGVGCVKDTQITGLDNRHATILGLSDGECLTWNEAQARIRAQVMPGDLTSLCAGCAWLDLGLCEDALARLHADST
ncbi:MAG: DUF1284 domain-containing protein [Rhodobacteraceae bacterium]|nr:DUF1284 domain-containing protein [Paracoccaceae bacterium]